MPTGINILLTADRLNTPLSDVITSARSLPSVLGHIGGHGGGTASPYVFMK